MTADKMFVGATGDAGIAPPCPLRLLAPGRLGPPLYTEVRVTTDLSQRRHREESLSSLSAKLPCPCWFPPAPAQELGGPG